MSTVRLSDEPDLELGAFRVRPAELVVERGTDRKRLEPRVMQVLVALARRTGETVSREQLLEECWGRVAVSDDAITRCVSQLRKVLAGGVAIEVVPKVGYRLSTLEAPRPSRRAAALFAGGAAALVSAGLIVATSGTKPAGDVPVALSRPLTAHPGVEQWPAISPSGGHVAYTWRNDLFVRVVGDGEPLQLTHTEEREFLPAFSPDGGRIAFVRRSGDDCGLHVVSSVGGAASKLASCGSGGVTALDWSPDGERLVFSTRESDLAPGRAFLLDPSSGEVEPVLSPEASASVEEVAFSPDGAEIAYALSTALGVEDLYVRRLDGGPARRITRDHLKIHGFDWLPDGSGFVVSSNRGGEFALWRVPRGGGAPSPIAGAVGGADEPKLSASGRLVYEVWRTSAGIWRYDLENESAPSALAASSRYDWDAELSPDGARLAFVSDRSGTAELWVSSAGGSSARKRTDFGGAYTHTPRFSPEGDRIAFSAPAEGNFDLFVVEADAPPRRVTDSVAEDFAPAWSPRGDALYFGSTRSGDWQIWRLDLESGVERRVTRNGGRVAQVAPDGRYLYYSKGEKQGLWRLDLEDGAEEECVLEDLEPVDWNNWQVLEEAIYYVRRPSPSAPEVVRRDLASGESRVVLEVPDLLYKSGLWVTPDESELLLTRVGLSESDLYWTELIAVNDTVLK